MTEPNPDTSFETTVRLLESGDHADWARLWDAYLTFYKTDLPDSIRRTAWERLMDPEEPVIGFIAHRDGKAVGIGNVIIHCSLWRLNPIPYLQDLYTDESVRGRGVGRAVIQAIYDYAREHEMEEVYWITHESNTRAQRLYDSIGSKTGFIQYKKASVRHRGLQSPS